jgi:hypothetical protein
MPGTRPALARHSQCPAAVADARSSGAAEVIAAQYALKELNT